MNIGVVGIGYWGSKVVGEYIDLAKEGIIDGVGICDVRQDVLQEFEGNDHVIRINEDYHAFLEDNAIDGVHVCVNNEQHYEVAKAALETGTHALLEKPMTTDAQMAYDLVELSANQGLILQVGHIFRFANVIRKAKELVEQGYFGDLYYCAMKWTTLMPPMEDIDIIWDLLPHPLDMVHFLSGKWPTGWQVTARSYRRDAPNEATFINLDYDDFMANVELSWVTPERKRLLEIIGSQRSAKVECVKQQMHVFEGNDDEFDMEIEDNNTIKAEALNFVNSIESKTMPFNSHIVGAKNVDVIQQIMESV